MNNIETNSITPLLSVRDLIVEYKTDNVTNHAVNGISFSIGKGETMGLVGETGAGKTTTALSLLQLLPERTGKIISGEIIFDEEDLLKRNDNQMREIRGEKISMIFQDPMTALNPVMNVGDQIAEAIILHNPDMKREEVKQSVEHSLKMVGIPAERKNEYPHQFSGGMKQRVVIAIALSCNPSLLIADEPTTALDVTIQAQVLSTMKNLKKEYGMAILMITHDLGIVAQVCDTVGVMYAGEIIEEGTVDDIFEEINPHHPYTVGLFKSIPDLESNDSRLSPIEGLMPDPADLPNGCKFSPRCPQYMDICKEVNPDYYVNDKHRVKCHLYVERKED